MLASATAPLTRALPATLPPHLAEMAKAGFAFTTAPHNLIVYTDGSSLGNGKVGARAGLGVYYGYGGRAEASNISERVPGEAQTNNRGELLVTCYCLDGRDQADHSVSHTCPRRLPISRPPARDPNRLAVYNQVYDRLSTRVDQQRFQRCQECRHDQTSARSSTKAKCPQQGGLQVRRWP